MKEGSLLPNAKLRDFDTTTLVHSTVDPLPEVAEYLKDLPTLKRYRRRIPRRMVRFFRRYWPHLTLDSMRMVFGSALMAAAPRLNAGLGFRKSSIERTCITSTEPLDPAYTPAFPVAPEVRHYFEPTMITDRNGALNPALVPDLTPPHARRRKRRKETVPSS